MSYVASRDDQRDRRASTYARGKTLICVWHPRPCARNQSVAGKGKKCRAYSEIHVARALPLLPSVSSCPSATAAHPASVPAAPRSRSERRAMN